MAYPPRVQKPGQLFHAYAHGVDECTIFRDDEDFLSFLGLVERECKLSGWAIVEYTLLHTHYHFLLELTQPTLSSGFQRLQSMYARSFNKKYGRRGALWEKRYDAVLIEHELHLFEVIRYIAWNAPKAGLCARPEDYAWCSYGAAVGVRPADRIADADRLLRHFGVDTTDAHRLLQALVDEKDPRGRPVSETSRRRLGDSLRTAAPAELREGVVDVAGEHAPA